MTERDGRAVYENAGLTEKYGLTVKCRFCGALGELPDPGQEPDVEHLPDCPRLIPREEN